MTVQPASEADEPTPSGAERPATPDVGSPGRRVLPLTEPRDGVPSPVTHASQLTAVVAALASGSGPVAVDAERASGYRYGQQAYLVQLRNPATGTVLLDPAALADLSAVGAAIQHREWVLHAASQDLPCLREVGMVATKVFDTELAARLLGHPRVGLGPLVEEVLGLALEKGHSAADWSTRPLPEPWLRYAALDVEVLLELRDALAAELAEQGKTEWAEQEFAAIVAAPPPASKPDRWRRTSGLHRVRKRRELAVVRELWERRDEVARRRDIAPGRVLPDAALVTAALASPTTAEELTALPVWGGRSLRRQTATWLPAIRRALDLPDEDLPDLKAAHEGPPPARGWADRDPAAAARLSTVRAAVAGVAEEHNVPAENVLAPDALRRLTWGPVEEIPLTPEAVAAFLRDHGAREWQIRLTAEPLAAALAAAEVSSTSPS